MAIDVSHYQANKFDHNIAVEYNTDIYTRRNYMVTGTVKWFNPNKGFGFIEPENGGNDVFVHITSVERSGLSGLDEGQKIQFEIEEQKGKQSACNLKVAS